jgi:hypothetical protein
MSQAPEDVAGPTGSDKVLATLLRQLHLLLAAGAAYLDEAADPR